MLLNHINLVKIVPKHLRAGILRQITEYTSWNSVQLLNQLDPPARWQISLMSNFAGTAYNSFYQLIQYVFVGTIYMSRWFACYSLTDFLCMLWFLRCCCYRLNDLMHWSIVNSLPSLICSLKWKKKSLHFIWFIDLPNLFKRHFLVISFTRQNSNSDVGRVGYLEK